MANKGRILLAWWNLTLLALAFGAMTVYVEVFFHFA